MKYDPVATGKRVRSLRTSRSLSQTKMAELCGFTDHSGVSKMEKGDQALTLEQIAAICDIFNVTSEFLLFGGDEQRIRQHQALIDLAKRLPPERVKEEMRSIAARYQLPLPDDL